MGKEYFCAYHSYLAAMEQLNNEERGRLFTALLSYSQTGKAPQLDGNERFVFPAMRDQMDRDSKKYQTIFYKGIMPSEKVSDLPVDCNTLAGSVNL